MRYETNLPSIHLEAETITELENILRTECTDPELEIKLDHGPVTYSFASAEKIIHDVTLPTLFRSFEVVLKAHEGWIKLTSDESETTFKLQLTGDQEWVSTRKREIEQFFQTRGSAARTFLEHYMGIGMAANTVIGCLGIYSVGLGGMIGMRTPVDALLFGALAIIFGGILHFVLEVIYPYTLIVTCTRQRGMLPYLAT